jgi:hypothetical protein
MSGVEKNGHLIFFSLFIYGIISGAIIGFGQVNYLQTFEAFIVILVNQPRMRGFSTQISQAYDPIRVSGKGLLDLFIIAREAGAHQVWMVVMFQFSVHIIRGVDVSVDINNHEGSPFVENPL